MVKCFNFTLKPTDECQKSKSERCVRLPAYISGGKKKKELLIVFAVRYDCICEICKRDKHPQL